MTKIRSLSMLAAALIPAALTPVASAAYTITALNTPVTENFNSYAGTAAPTHFTVTGASAFRGQNDGSGNQNGAYAFGTGSDYALGFLASASATTTAVATAGFVNSTGASIDEIAISFDGEQWRVGGRPSSISVAYSINGGSFIDLPALAYVAPDISGGSTGRAGTGEASLRSFTISSLDFNAGDTLNLRWTYVGNGDGSGTGARSGLAIDNLSVTGSAVPEPMSLGVIGLGAVALLRRRRA